MPTRSYVPVVLSNVLLLSSDTSTSVPTAVDLANYFPVGRREVMFTVNFIPGSTALGVTGTTIIEENDSTSTTTFTSVLTYSGSTLTVTSTANSVNTLTSLYGVVTKRYLRARNVGSTSTGSTLGLCVVAFPMVRVA